MSHSWKTDTENNKVILFQNFHRAIFMSIVFHFTSDISHYLIFKLKFFVQTLIENFLLFKLNRIISLTMIPKIKLMDFFMRSPQYS